MFSKKKTKTKNPKQSAHREESERGAAKASKHSMGYLKNLHQQVATDAFKNILAKPFASFLNCLMIGVAFALPALLYLMVINLQVLGNGWEGQPRISLYLETGLSDKQIRAIRNQARDDQDITNFTFISPGEGLKEFQEKAQLSSVFDALGFNPLPPVLELEPRSSFPVDKLGELLQRYKVKKGVAEARLDREWVERLAAITGLVEQFALLLSGLLAVMVVLTIGNTVRLSVESRRAEIQVIKLVGGTDGFVALPFLYMGVWYGLGGAFLALLTVWLIQAGVMSGVLELTSLYGSSFEVQGPDSTLVLSLLAAGWLLGFAGALASCYRHLRDMEQKVL
ncbi:cell division protein [Endozoicomonas sp. OPT23]|uniref:permease-like cell division protein FtsX n=1 Tax=Endozoicomonas sp. OPT23 TaxID=2072845 RepID=UPI00129B9EF1|nr:permease-like cell division protein FtsX [Endozoicomonas sp. OPT23]MRI32512.1 cell division protein [Endozoicomonas sp. OPT23]